MPTPPDLPLELPQPSQTRGTSRHRARSLRWSRARFLALLLPLLLTLPSCMTSLLWGARDSGSTRAGIDSQQVRVITDARGLVQVAVQLGEDLPEELGRRRGAAFFGQWLVIDVQASPAVAEVLRLQQNGFTTDASFAIWLHRDGDVRIDAATTLADEQLDALHMQKGLRVANAHDRPFTVSASANGVLRDAGAAPSATAPPGDRVPLAALHWWRPAADDARHSLPTRLVLTPVTVVMDVALGPVVALAGLYALVYTGLGGRG